MIRKNLSFMMQGGEQFRIQISTNAVLYSDKEKNALKETENRISKVLSKYTMVLFLPNMMTNKRLWYGHFWFPCRKTLFG